MTSEAPKEIWIEDEFGEGHEDQWSYGAWDCRNVYGYVISYTLTTHAQAMVAAAYEDAADTCFAPKWKPKCSTDWVQARTAGTIRARTPDDAQAALDALLRAERVKALREAADCIGHITQAEDRDAILALIEKETGQ